MRSTSDMCGDQMSTDACPGGAETVPVTEAGRGRGRTYGTGCYGLHKQQHTQTETETETNEIVHRDFLIYQFSIQDL